MWLPVGNDMPTHSTVCLDYFNEIVSRVSTGTGRQHFVSHEPVCDLLRKRSVVRQRCSDIEHVGVSHVAHAEVQFLCQEWTVHGWCDIKHVEGYTTASNTSKCKAVEFTSALASRTGNENCTFKSCDVPSSFVNALHTSVERHYLDSVTCGCKSGYSPNELRYGTEERSGCMSDCIHDATHLLCLPINGILEEVHISKTIKFPDDVVFVDRNWNKNSAVSVSVAS